MAVALIVAAGRGERLGAGGPKAFVPVAGRPMLEWSVAALRQVPAVRAIVVALPADRLADAPAGVTAVAGGVVRSESVRAALAASLVGGTGDPDEAVIVHDAARTMALPELFVAALAELEATGADAVIAAAPVSDTIKRTDSGLRVAETVDRSALWAVQTPQVFRRRALTAALTEASEELLARATDDAWLIEQAGGSVAILPAPHDNFKITTPLDLRLAELMLSERLGIPAAGGLGLAGDELVGGVR
jgi:2-C-methyl-D-erythritol 4-phosphate cytidylyltransferase